MKKILFWTFIAACCTVIIALGVGLISAFHTKSALPSAKESKEKDQRLEEQVSYIGGTPEPEVELNQSTTEETVIETMHKMTHQKVYSPDKWGAVEMTSANIQKVKHVLEINEFEHKAQLLQILTRWENNDFSTVVEDHNYFWTLQGGNIGEATGRLSESDEKTFIKNNFR